MLGVSTLFIRFAGFWVLASQCLLAQPQFLRREIRLPDFGGLVTIADVNGDSRPDILFLARAGLSVVLNTGGGNFSAPIVTSGCWLPAVAADFNGDGNLDLAQSPWRMELDAAALEICFGRGDGSFLPPRQVSGEFPSFVGLVPIGGDFNGDQKPDLVLGAREGFTLGGPTNYVILLGNGDGTFRSGPITEIGSGELYAADLNLDGRSDLALLPSSCWALACGYASSLDCSISIFFGKENGGFEAPTRLHIPETAGLLLADLNRDGRPDIATATAVLLGNGDGSFQTPWRSRSPATCNKPMAAADLDGDGDADLVMFHQCEYEEGSGAWVWPGKGDGTLAGDEVNLSEGGGYHLDRTFDYYFVARSAVDLDGDGRPDLVTAKPGGITVLLNRAEGFDQATARPPA